MNLTDHESAARGAAEFWSSVESGEVRLPFCTVCDAAFFYPRAVCPRCHGSELEYRVPGPFTIRTFTWVYRPQAEEFQNDVPILMLVGEGDGTRIIAEGRGWTQARPPRIGDRARVITIRRPTGRFVAGFEPEEEG